MWIILWMLLQWNFKCHCSNRTIWLHSLDVPFTRSLTILNFTCPIWGIVYHLGLKKCFLFMRDQLKQWSITLNPFPWQSTESSPRWPPCSHWSVWEAYLAFLTSAQWQLGLKFHLFICFLLPWLCLIYYVKHKKIFPQFGLHWMTTGFDRPKILIIWHVLSLVAVPVNASTGTEGIN